MLFVIHSVFSSGDSRLKQIISICSSSNAQPFNAGLLLLDKIRFAVFVSKKENIFAQWRSLSPKLLHQTIDRRRSIWGDISLGKGVPLILAHALKTPQNFILQGAQLEFEHDPSAATDIVSNIRQSRTHQFHFRFHQLDPHPHQIFPHCSFPRSSFPRHPNYSQDFPS